MNNTLLKGLAVLELLSRSDRPMGLTQIAREAGIVKSNAHRLMQGLVEARFVLRDPDSGAFSPSIKLWELGSAVLSRLDVRRHAELQMEALMERCGESVHLSVLDGRDVVYVHKVDSASPVRAYTQIGGRAPAHCVATGKALLAFGSPARLEQMAGNLTRFTPRTLVDPAGFLREMKNVRARGYATNRGEWREEVWGLAAPIRDARGTVIAALGISGPAERLRRAGLARWADAVKQAADEVAQAMGAGPRLTRIPFVL